MILGLNLFLSDSCEIIRQVTKNRSYNPPLNFPMPDLRLANEFSLLESLSKLFATSLGVLYLFGFLVVASYLSRYGVSSFSVLQLQYLIAGIWVLGPPVLHASLMYAVRRFEERAAPDVKGKFNWRRFTISSFLTQLPLSLFVVLIFVVPGFFESMTWGMGIRFFLFYLGMVNCAQLYWRSWRADTDKETWWMNRSHAAPFYLALLFMLVISYTVWFSVRIYPLIPFSLGAENR